MEVDFSCYVSSTRFNLRCLSGKMGCICQLPEKTELNRTEASRNRKKNVFGSAKHFFQNDSPNFAIKWINYEWIAVWREFCQSGIEDENNKLFDERLHSAHWTIQYVCSLFRFTLYFRLEIIDFLTSILFDRLPDLFCFCLIVCQPYSKIEN